MIDGLEWVESPETPAREIMAQLVNVDEAALKPFVISAHVASLPFYRAWMPRCQRARLRRLSTAGRATFANADE